MSNFTRGSEWIRCDLHVHTPFSIEQHYGDKYEISTWEKFISDIENLPKEFKIIGINDYLFIDGYEKVLEYKAKGRLQNIELILPVIELRIGMFGSVTENSPLKRVNLHFIFSNELSVDIIKTQFLVLLNSHYKLSADNKDFEWNGLLDFDSLIDLGNKIIKSSEGKIKESPIKVGFNAFNVEYKSLIEKAESNSFLKGKFLTAVGKTEWDSLRWTGSISDKKDVINRVDFVFTASENQLSFESARNSLIEQNVNSFLLDCSDAHHFSYEVKIKDRIGNCLTWMKINPTFEGLKYLKSEEKERLYIGEQPAILDRVHNNKNKYIEKIIVESIPNYNLEHGTWFTHHSIPLNRELTVIIGNKGKGKSALTDIIGLCGNSSNSDYFSFLNDKKFKRRGIAKSFQATLEWESGNEDFRNLNDLPNENEIERVKYLPQSYFETLCNDVDDNEVFKKELNQVVFSHIDETERLGKNNFDHFIREKRLPSEKDITELRNQLEDLNGDISQLTELSTIEYKKRLASSIEAKKKELLSHLEIEPLITKTPLPAAEDIVKTKNDDKDSDELSTIEAELENLNKKKEDGEIKLSKLFTDLEILNRVEHSLKSEKERNDRLRLEIAEDLKVFGIEINKVLSEFNIDLVELKAKIEEINNEKIKVQLHLGKIQYTEYHKNIVLDETKLLIGKINKLNDKKSKIVNRLSEEQKEIQKLKLQREKWQLQLVEIKGAAESPKEGTLNYLELQLQYLNNNLQTEIINKKRERDTITEKIFDKKLEIISVYAQIKKNVDLVLDNNSDTIEDYAITLEASLSFSGLINNFLDFVDKKKQGAFYGSVNAEKNINTLISECDSNNKMQVIKLVNTLADMLQSYNNNIYNPFSQLKAGKELHKLYDYLFGLDYLETKYELRFMGKNIEQLSPGERGAALIVFYLLLDKEDIPLLIDQPEDNLDNQSVYKILVPFIKQAKKRRQLIIVTHNPNLAIVSDAEEVIHVELDKENGNIFSFTSGAIENPVINKGIVDILEGTQPAFNKRKMKYFD